MRTVFGTMMTMLAVSITLALPARADLSREDIQMCTNGCIGQVLAGERELTDCLLLPLATRQIVGPPARTKSEADLQPIARVVEAVLRERLERYASDFVGAEIEINYVQPSARQPHIYGIGGWVRRPGSGDYEFSANGLFSSPTDCRLYTLAVGPINVNRWLRDQEAVDEAIQIAIRQWSRQP